MMQFKNLPVEIQQRMLDEQERQGNPRNAEIFEKNTAACLRRGGFSWKDSVDGYDFWAEIIQDANFVDFYKKYPKQKL
jgi:hypothetical protein